MESTEPSYRHVSCYEPEIEDMREQIRTPAKNARRTTAVTTAMVALAFAFASFGAAAIYVDLSNAYDAKDRTHAMVKHKTDQVKDDVGCAADYVGHETDPKPYLQTLRPAPECMVVDPPSVDADRLTGKATAKTCGVYDEAVESAGTPDLTGTGYIQDPVEEAAAMAPDCPEDQGAHWV